MKTEKPLCHCSSPCTYPAAECIFKGAVGRFGHPTKICGSNSVVEYRLPKATVEGSIPFSRS